MKKLVLITGGTGGIGKATAIFLKKKGYHVIVNYNKNIKEALLLNKEYGIETKQWNVANYEECIKATLEIEQNAGQHINILVNNAGINKDVMLHKMSKSDWDDVININLNSCFNMSRAVINGMRNNLFGRIVNISSINAQTGQAGQTNYCASKGAIISFTKALARESATKNITVNCITPGYIETNMTAKMNPEILQNLVSNIPIKRLGKPSEVAQVIEFLINEETNFITGETISVNGGHNMA